MIGESKGIGLYIDTYRVFAVQLSKKYGRVGLMGYADAEYDPTAEEGADPKRPTLGVAFNTVLTKLGADTKSVAGALPGKDSIVRYFEMPLIPKEEWPTAIRYEAQKYVTLSTEDLYVNYEVFRDVAQKRMHVVFLASSKAVVHKLMETYLDAGLDLHALEPIPLSLVRAFLSENPIKEGEIHSIIDLHADGVIHILLVRGPVLLMARDSVILKSQEGNEDVRVPDYRALMTEINLSFSYFLKNFKNEEIKSVYLLKEQGDIFYDWDKRLSNELGMIVETFSLNKLFGTAKEYSPGRSIALGLALREVAKTQYKNTNLIPSDVLKTQKKAVESLAAAEVAKTTVVDDRSVVQKKILLVAGGVAAVVIVIHVLLMLIVMSQKNALDKLLKNIAKPSSVSNISAPVAELSLTDKRMKEQLKYLSALMENRVTWTVKMAEIARTLPASVEISSMIYNDNVLKDGGIVRSVHIDGRVYVQGANNPLDDVNRFAVGLKSDKEFMRGLSEVKIVSIHRSAERIDFVIECKGSENK